MTDRRYRDREWLEEQYVECGRSSYDLAAECGMTGWTILNWVERHGLEKHPPHGDNSRKEYATFRLGGEGYEQWESTHRNPETNDGRDRVHKSIRVHVLLAISLGADPSKLFGKDSENVVHHRNGNSWDNRPGNIVVMDRGEHMRHHRAWEQSPSVLNAQQEDGR